MSSIKNKSYCYNHFIRSGKNVSVQLYQAGHVFERWILLS